MLLVRGGGFVTAVPALARDAWHCNARHSLAGAASFSASWARRDKRLVKGLTPLDEHKGFAFSSPPHCPTHILLRTILGLICAYDDKLLNRKTKTFLPSY